MVALMVHKQSFAFFTRFHTNTGKSQTLTSMRSFGTAIKCMKPQMTQLVRLADKSQWYFLAFNSKQGFPKISPDEYPPQEENFLLFATT